MFCRNILQINRFNKLVLNRNKLILFKVKYISNSFNTRSGFGEESVILAENRDKKVLPNNGKNQFFKDHNFRNQILEQIFVLSQNVIKGNRNLNQLIDEKDFDKMCQMVTKNVFCLKTRQIINCLNSLLTIGLEPNTQIVQTLENELLWLAKDMSLKELLDCLSFHVRYQTTEQQKKVVKELTINLVLKLDSATDDFDVIQMLSLWRSLSPEIIEKMEMTALDMITRNEDNNFKINNLSYILVLLSQMNRRTKPLIKAVVDKFTYCPIDPNECKESHLIKMISSLNKLNYSDINFMRKASDLLCNKKFLNTVAPSDRRDLLVAVSQMNWSYPRLLDQYIEKITDTNNDFSSQDFLVLISSFARLYSRSYYLNDILNTYVIPFVRREDLDSESWLLYVWSLSILGCAPLKSIDSVLNQEFYNQLIDKTSQMASNESSNYRQIVSKLKLLNIKAVAEIEMNHKIDLNLLLTKDCQTVRKEAAIERFKKSIQKELHLFLSNISSNVCTPFGFTIDAEFIINKDMDSLPLTDFGSLGVNPFNEMPTLPEGFRRYAVLCFGFNDTFLDGSGLIGVHELWIRLLKRMGYCVIPINERQFPSYLKDINRTEKLKAIINTNIK